MIIGRLKTFKIKQAPINVSKTASRIIEVFEGIRQKSKQMNRIFC
jgi:hypothetical protein